MSDPPEFPARQMDGHTNVNTGDNQMTHHWSHTGRHSPSIAMVTRAGNVSHLPLPPMALQHPVPSMHDLGFPVHRLARPPPHLHDHDMFTSDSPSMMTMPVQRRNVCPPWFPRAQPRYEPRYTLPPPVRCLCGLCPYYPPHPSLAPLMPGHQHLNHPQPPPPLSRNFTYSSADSSSLIGHGSGSGFSPWTTPSRLVASLRSSAETPSSGLSSHTQPISQEQPNPLPPDGANSHMSIGEDAPEVVYIDSDDDVQADKSTDVNNNIDNCRPPVLQETIDISSDSDITIGNTRSDGELSAIVTSGHDEFILSGYDEKAESVTSSQSSIESHRRLLVGGRETAPIQTPMSGMSRVLPHRRQPDQAHHRGASVPRDIPLDGEDGGGRPPKR